jgi:hypothetical protein
MTIFRCTQANLPLNDLCQTVIRRHGPSLSDQARLLNASRYECPDQNLATWRSHRNPNCAT